MTKNTLQKIIVLLTPNNLINNTTLQINTIKLHVY